MAHRRKSITWSPEARNDLADIWSDYLNIAGWDTADEIIRGIVKACQILADYPLAGRVRDEVRPKLRSITTSPYIIFYKIGKDVPEIVRVLDSRRDIDEIFTNES